MDDDRFSNKLVCGLDFVLRPFDDDLYVNVLDFALR